MGVAVDVPTRIKHVTATWLNFKCPGRLRNNLISSRTFPYLVCIHAELLAYCALFLDVPSIGQFLVCSSSLRSTLWDNEAWWELLANNLNLDFAPILGLVEGPTKSRS